MNGPEGFLPKKTKFYDAGGPGTVVPPTKGTICGIDSWRCLFTTEYLHLDEH